MLELSKNIKIALCCTIMPIALSFLLQRHGFYNAADIQMFSLFTVAIFSLAFKKVGDFLYNTLSKIGKFLGKYLAIIALFFVYIFAVMPTGLLMKIVKRDRLSLKKPNTNTYWKKYENTNTDYEYQF